mmetsp:Transcript_78604/g.218453  ORF Transcript_78604/g.218453 Transcript_78604/m.218453 type:complete len:205 (-) Transcript_78604:167-781(-)
MLSSWGSGPWAAVARSTSFSLATAPPSGQRSRELHLGGTRPCEPTLLGAAWGPQRVFLLSVSAQVLRRGRRLTRRWASPQELWQKCALLTPCCWSRPEERTRSSPVSWRRRHWRLRLSTSPGGAAAALHRPPTMRRPPESATSCGGASPPAGARRAASPWTTCCPPRSRTKPRRRGPSMPCSPSRPAASSTWSSARLSGPSPST